jgi:hypothetical protein
MDSVGIPGYTKQIREFCVSIELRHLPAAGYNTAASNILIFSDIFNKNCVFLEDTFSTLERV